MFSKIIILTWILQLVFKEINLSVVIDSLSQKGIVVSDYCPKMPYCEEGAHVMCMYYDPTRIMGPRCSNPRNVTMTSELAIKLLEVSNAIRGKLAMGLEKGKGGKDFPRAYGMFKLHWDNELATFAQVLANQCVLRHDMCRATKKFPDPGQTAGLIRFSTPDWFPIHKGGQFTQAGLIPSKVTYAVTQVLKSWYGQKISVTPSMLIDYPDWTLFPTKQNGRPYLEMISAPATHMGCGISAYAEYVYHDSRSPLNYNSIQVICNYSSRPKKHQTVFDLEPGPHTSQCGCPVNAVEDENCLCTYVEEEIVAKEELNCDGVNCEQPVIILPIFTVEDAPPSRLLGRNQKTVSKPKDETRRKRPNLSDAAKSLEPLKDHLANVSKIEHPIVKVLNKLLDNEITSVQHPPHAPNRKVLEKTPPKKKSLKVPTINRNQKRKTSVFSRSSIINPTTMNNPFKLSLKTVKKDVVTRKDFSEAKSLVNNYMESIKNYSDLRYKSHLPDPFEIITKRYSNGPETVHNAEDNVIDKFGYEGDRDKNVMTLLDKLEEEVQHIELTGDKKELFDAKIRKIYDSILGKQSGGHFLMKHNSHSENIANGEIEKLTNLDHNNDDKNEIISLKHNKIDENDVAKTIDDIVHSSHNDFNEQHSYLNGDNDRPTSRLRIKARINPDRGRESDYEFRLRENLKDLQNIHGDSDNEYISHRFPEYRKSYISKNQDHSHEDDAMNRFNDNIRKSKKVKHKEYYSSIENSNKNHYKRHQTRNDEHLDDVLSPERRKYYRQRLENLERQLQNTRSRKYRNEDEHHRKVIHMRSSDDESSRKSRKKRIEHFDMRGRSKFIHGY